MEPRISLITLGVMNLALAIRFYEGLGFPRKNTTAQGVAFFDLNGVVLSLFPREDLAKDAQVHDSQPGFSGISLAHNVRKKAEVAVVLAKAESLGAKILKPAQDTFWGGHAGYFQDLDGHLWEIAWNPFFPIDEDGRIALRD